MSHSSRDADGIESHQPDYQEEEKASSRNGRKEKAISQTTRKRRKPSVGMVGRRKPDGRIGGEGESKHKAE